MQRMTAFPQAEFAHSCSKGEMQTAFSQEVLLIKPNLFAGVASICTFGLFNILFSNQALKWNLAELLSRGSS